MQPIHQEDVMGDYPGRRARFFLNLAFGLPVAILLAAGWNALTTSTEMHVREEAARLDFLLRTEPIVQVRSSLIIYGNLLQESVASEKAPSSKAKEAFRQVQAELERYPPLRKPAGLQTPS